MGGKQEGDCSRRTFLEHLSAIHLDQTEVGVFVLFAVTHVGQAGSWGGGERFGEGDLVVAVEALIQNHHVAVTQVVRDGSCCIT